MVTKQNVPLSAFAIAVLCFFKTHTKGTVLFFKSEEEHGKLIIESGEIVALQYNGKESEEALKELKGLTTVRYRCYPYRLPPKNHFHISLEDFFKKIGNLDLTNPPEKRNTPEPQKQEEQKRESDLTAILDSLKQSLHDALGPISEFIYEDAIEELGIPISLDKIEALSDKLANEISNPEHRGEFQEKIKSITGSMVYSKALNT